MESRVNIAVNSLRDGFSCAQAVFTNYCELFGVEKNTGYRIAGGFGAGMGRMQEVCGAVTGAIMLIGLKYGNIDSEDIEAREKTYDLTRKLCENFKSKNGTINCREILGCDISTPEGIQFAKDNNLFSSKCAKCVENAAKIVEEILF